MLTSNCKTYERDYERNDKSSLELNLQLVLSIHTVKYKQKQKQIEKLRKMAYSNNKKKKQSRQQSRKVFFARFLTYKKCLALETIFLQENKLTCRCL